MKRVKISKANENWLISFRYQFPLIWFFNLCETSCLCKLSIIEHIIIILRNTCFLRWTSNWLRKVKVIVRTDTYARRDIRLSGMGINWPQMMVISKKSPFSRLRVCWKRTNSKPGSKWKIGSGKMWWAKWENQELLFWSIWPITSEAFDGPIWLMQSRRETTRELESKSWIRNMPLKLETEPSGTLKSWKEELC